MEDTGSFLSPEDLQEKHPFREDLWKQDQQHLKSSWDTHKTTLFSEPIKIPEVISWHGNLINNLPPFVRSNGVRHPDFDGPHHSVTLADLDINEEPSKLVYTDALTKSGTYVEIPGLDMNDKSAVYDLLSEAAKKLFDKVQELRNRQSLIRKLFGR